MSTAPFAVVTCGPAWTPVDAVRRITNHSTGELGTLLCESLVTVGCKTVCLRGEMATHQPPREVMVIPFSTNDSLLELLKNLPRLPDVFFHAAALSDYEVAGVEGAAGAQKIRSDAPDLRITLRPARKILPLLRGLFPATRIIGWKYELDGTPADARARAEHQIASAFTDACVVNGSAYGDGFGFVTPGSLTHFADRADLAHFLADGCVIRR